MSDMMDYEDEEVGLEPTSNEPWTPKKRMRFSTDKDVNRDTPDNSVKAAELFLSQRNPELYQDQAAVSLSKQAQEMGKARGKADTFGNKMEASVMQLNTFINSNQGRDLEAARKSKHKMEYSHAELTDGVPPEFILPLMDERNKYGDVAALVLKQQIQEDVANNTILDNLEWYSAIGYGVLQAVVDPTTYVGGAVGYKVGANMSKVANKATQYLGKSVPKVADDLTRWASASTVEAALTNAPRLGGDHTYKPEDYLTDVMVDAVVGTGLTYGASQLLKGAGVLSTKLEKRRATQREAIESMNREVETGQAVNADTNAWKHIAPESAYMDKPFAKVTDDVVRTHAYRYDVSGSEWNQFTPGETVLKIDQMLESKAFKIDNDMQWLALEAKDLAVQVELLNKFRNKVDLTTLQNHPAINNPTKANVVDMVRKLQVARDKAGDLAGKQAAIDGAGQVKFPEVSMMDRPKLRDLRYTKYDSKRLGMFARLNDELAAKVEGLDMVKDKGEGWDALTGIVHDAVRLHQGGVNVESLLSRLMRNDVFMNASPERYAKYVQGARAELDKVLAYANKRGNDSKAPSPLSEEMSAVLAKFDAEVASARLRRESLVKNPVTKIEYPSVMEVSKYPVQSKELKAAVAMGQRADEVVEQYNKPVKVPRLIDRDDVYFHGGFGDFDEFKAAPQTGGLIFFTKDAKIANEYATLKRVGFGTMDAAEDAANLEVLAQEFGHAFTPEGMLKSKVSKAELEDILFSSNIGYIEEVVLGKLRSGSITSEQAIAAFNEFRLQLNTGGHVRAVKLELRNTLGSQDYPISWKVAHSDLNAEKLRAQGYDSIWVDEPGGVALAVIDPKQIKSAFDETVVPSNKQWVESDNVSIAELEEVAKRLDAEQKAEAEAAPEGAEPKKMLQFTDVTNLDSAAIKAVSKGLMKDNWNGVTAMIANYHGSGEHKVYQDLLRPASIGQFAAKAVSQWGGVTKDLATKFIESDNPTLNWIGTHFTEMGRGYGGDVMRKHTAAVIREAEYVRSVSKVLPHYDKAVKEYAASKGANAVQEMMAAVSTGGKNKLQDEFSRKLMLYLNAQRLGKPLPNEPIIAKFAKQWDDYMLHNYTTLVDNHIKGFTGMNRIQHYAPQIWKVEHAKRMMRDGVDLLPLLQKAMRTENPIEDAKALEAWLKSDDAMGDMYVATNDARSVERLNVDWSAEHDGVSLLDLIETDTRKLATNYSNRVAGWAGVSKASGGNITSYTALHTLQKAAFEHNKDPRDFQVVGDVIDMLFGRPVQGGLADWQRSLKTASVLTKLGGLGSAQLIETSAVAARSIMESTGDPQFMKKVLKGMNPDEMAEDLRELQNLTGYNWDYHLINVEAEYYTDYDLAQTSRVRNAVDWAVDKATFGGLKPMVGRAFGHVTGYNMVRKYQEAMLQRSFAMQVARHFVLGKSKMSPKRMADYGLTDVNGVNDALAKTIRENVEFDADGYPTKYNFDKWEPKAKETFMYALQRAEATELLRPLVGEMPEWWNKPWVQMLMQFRTMPIAAQNKALGRSLAFADKEAALQLALNCMTAGLVRHSKFALMAAVAVGVGDEWAEEYKKQVDRAGKDALLGGAADRYITQLGGIGDVYALSHLYGGAETPEQYVRKTMNQVPALSLVGSYVDAAYAASTGDGDKAMSHAERIIFLNNTMAFEATGAVIEAVAKGD
ncbi:hypothetical protein [Vibrio phage JSF7]|uniref:Uncharacterized protein n=1 Tax=Vibrio phage JSF7 TaxID=1292086 RepID=A0A240EWW3_9CAUD|nr:hypothetical protein HOQ92_gp31 [Vibrio phage JSF7]APD18155.1 hypothetical protein [Vibrio phage JSF7]